MIITPTFAHLLYVLTFSLISQNSIKTGCIFLRINYSTLQFKMDLNLNMRAIKTIHLIRLKRSKKRIRFKVFVIRLYIGQILKVMESTTQKMIQ